MNASAVKRQPSTALSLIRLLLGVVLMACALCSLSADTAAQADEKRVELAGTHVSLAQPSGFVVAADFPGFAQKATSSSVMVTELPVPFAQTTAGFTQPMLAARGMTLLSRQAILRDGAPRLLIHLTQRAYGAAFEKWVYAFGDAKRTTLITATFPQEQSPKLSATLKAAILSVQQSREIVDPFSDLRFQISAQAPLKFAQRVGNTLMFLKSGKSSAETAMFMAGYGLSEIGPVDRKRFALKRLTQAPVLQQTLLSTTPVVIGGLQGYENTATGYEAKGKTPVTLYQVMLFDGKTYFLMFGIAPSGEAAQVIPTFRATAASFRRK